MLVDKVRASSRARRGAFLLALGLSICAVEPLLAISLSTDDARRIGRRIWQNECNGTIAGLTSWNAGEDFASLGIGHFIWYPAGRRGPFEESFPTFLAFARARNVRLPAWLGKAKACPWNSRVEFEKAQASAEMTELRQLLASTVDVQTQFLIDRLEGALPKMLSEAVPANRQNVEQQFARLAATAQGCYALIDYVNFKGEGVLPTERYQGQGWGLLQALEKMQPNPPDAVAEFARATGTVLKQRVANSPPARHESRWLPGWLNRVTSYNRR